ncbi:MAG: hypothetical protein ACJAYK_002226 [Crocinitomicaceae bacterium]|jgi:hypothetical protein
MTKMAILIFITWLILGCEFSTDLNVPNIKGYEFNLHDIQEYCTIKRQGDKHLDVTCAKKELRLVMGACEGQMTAGLVDPAFYCSGGLWILNDVCYIQMLDTHNGNIRCKKQ